MPEMSEAAKNCRREYFREYRQKNRERIRQNARNRWERKAMEQSVEADEPKTEEKNNNKTERNMRTMSENIIIFKKKAPGAFWRPNADVVLTVESEDKDPRYKFRFNAETSALLETVCNFYFIEYNPVYSHLYFIPSNDKEGYKMYQRQSVNQSAYLRVSADENLVLKPFAPCYYSLTFSAQRKAYYIDLNKGTRIDHLEV